MKSSWNKIAHLPESWKSEQKARKKRQKTEWQTRGELKGIRIVAKRFVKAS